MDRYNSIDRHIDRHIYDTCLVLSLLQDDPWWEVQAQLAVLAAALLRTGDSIV